MSKQGRYVLGSQRDRFVVGVPGVEGADVIEYVRRIEAGIVAPEEAERRQAGVHALRITLEGRPEHSQLRRHPGARHLFGHPKVDERDSPVGPQQEVPRLGIARELGRNDIASQRRTE